MSNKSNKSHEDSKEGLELDAYLVFKGLIFGSVFAVTFWVILFGIIFLWATW